MSEERPLEDELLELIGHRFQRGLINVIDLANLELTPNAVERSDSVVSLIRIKSEALQALNVVDAMPCELFDLAARVQRLMPELQRQAAAADVSFISDAPRSPLEVLGSVEHLQNILPLLLEFVLWQGKPDKLRLQIVPDSTTVRLLLQFDTLAATPTAMLGEPMPLANLLSLWAYTRAINICGGQVFYASVLANAAVIIEFAPAVARGNLLTESST